MDAMDLLTIPGLDGSRKLERMRKQSSARMKKNVQSQRMTAALMTAAAISSKKSPKK